MLALGAWALAATPPLPTLPSFAGWQKSRQAISTRSGWGLPAPDASAMAEYGLQAVERDVFQRGARSIQVQGLRFADAAGAYGAFTYYRPANFHPFDLGQPKEQAASGDTHILFTRGPWLIQVQMDQLTAMTASDMRSLAAHLAPPPGTSLTLPTLPYYLPRAHLQPNSVHYAEGPAGFAAACDWLPPEAVGFDKSAEAVVANYDLPTAGAVQLLILSYPTPTMARTHWARWKSDRAFTIRRSGPLLVLVQGAAGAPVEQLAEAVNFDADITLVPPVPVGINALPALILGIFMLCALIICVSIVVGVLTGGLRALLQRFWPQRFAHLSAESLIRLNLK